MLQANVAKVGAAGFILTANMHVLLTLRSENCTDNHNLWQLPGGKVEGSETIRIALAREILEETNLTVTPTYQFPPLYVIIKSQGWMNICYRCEYVHNELANLKNMEPHKHADLKFWNIFELPENISPATKRFIDLFTTIEKNNRSYKTPTACGVWFANTDIETIYES